MEEEPWTTVGRRQPALAQSHKGTEPSPARKDRDHRRTPMRMPDGNRRFPGKVSQKKFGHPKPVDVVRQQGTTYENMQILQKKPTKHVWGNPDAGPSYVSPAHSIGKGDSQNTRPSTRSQVAVKGSTQVNTKSQTTRKKNKPKPSHEIGLGSFLQGPRNGIIIHKKKQPQSKQSKPPTVASSNKGKVSNPNRLDSTVTSMVRQGKTRAPGLKKRKRLTTLKKYIYSGRRYMWYLAEPHRKCVPLVVHPVLYDYVVETPTSSGTLWDGEVVEDEVVQSLDDIICTVEASFEKENWNGCDRANDNSDNDEASGNGEASDDEGGNDSDGKVSSDESENGEAEAGWDSSRLHPVFFGSCFEKVPLDKKMDEDQVVKKDPLEQRFVRTTRLVREYVCQSLSVELNDVVTTLLGRLMFLQERLRKKDPMKLQMRRRLVFGLREVNRGIRSRRCKCIIVALNIEKGPVSSLGEVGLDKAVKELIDNSSPTAEEMERGVEGVEVVFALTRKALGKALGKQRKVSAVGIYNLDGAHEEYKKMLKLTKVLRSHWASITTQERVSGIYATCSDCERFIVDTRYDCMECKTVRCSRCADSCNTKKVPCSSCESCESHPCLYAEVTRCVPRDVVEEQTKLAESKREETKQRKQASRRKATKTKLSPSASVFMPHTSKLVASAPEFIPTNKS
eukprot:CAMPEP_0203747386 /NCGR_PEP_ID=MMETSP0098-20131031/2552_1 /ASSEMBLY_ACC=CAM_ASM_000208 /TAXON_ID=96639 /ORGANISM=" , Strain NY0313808BC1" /LENGTH=677 /DNA_ID=CAMNT_0050635799 /DNA_START=121 /DNA_END=2154 /DNA_ORIENTATION=+